ncbi:hypothetical protein AB0N20_27295 [Streptomyces griseoincarnatus]
MTRIVIGASVVAVSLALLAAVVWFWWLAGHGRHRAPRRPATAEGRDLLVTTAAPDLTGSAPALPAFPPVPSVLPSREDLEEAGRDADTVALLLDADRADFAHCPAEGRRTPHFLHSSGARTCARCETTTAGDQT